MRKILLIIICLVTVGCDDVNIFTYKKDGNERYFCEDYISLNSNRFSKNEDFCINRNSTKETIELLIEDINSLKKSIEKAHEENEELEKHLKLSCSWKHPFEPGYCGNCDKYYSCEKLKRKQPTLKK